MNYTDIKSSQSALESALRPYHENLEACREVSEMQQQAIDQAIEIESNRQRTLLRQALTALGRGNETEVKALLEQYTKGKQI